MLPEPASLSCCTSRWDNVSRLPLGLTEALITCLWRILTSMNEVRGVGRLCGGSVPGDWCVGYHGSVGSAVCGSVYDRGGGGVVPVFVGVSLLAKLFSVVCVLRYRVCWAFCFAPYARVSFFSRQKRNQKGSPHHTALRCATGSLASSLLQGSAKRAFHGPSLPFAAPAAQPPTQRLPSAS